MTQCLPLSVVSKNLFRISKWRGKEAALLKRMDAHVEALESGVEEREGVDASAERRKLAAVGAVECPPERIVQ